MNIYYVEVSGQRTYGPTLDDMGSECERLWESQVVYAPTPEAAVQVVYRTVDDYYMDDEIVIQVGTAPNRKYQRRASRWDESYYAWEGQKLLMQQEADSQAASSSERT